MPSSTATAKPDPGMKHTVDEESEDDLPFQSAHSDSGSGSESKSGSDSLDSSGPRKRRRTSPDLVLESDDEEPESVLKAIPSFSAPSRIKSAAVDKPAQDGHHLKNPPQQVLAPTDPNTSFESLDVRPWLVRSLANMAIKRPTGIQKGCIPEILRGRDCIGGSRTGSGKTVAFAVPVLQKWAEDPSGIFAVVLTPTR